MTSPKPTLCLLSACMLSLWAACQPVERPFQNSTSTELGPLEGEDPSDEAGNDGVAADDAGLLDPEIEGDDMDSSLQPAADAGAVAVAQGDAAIAVECVPQGPRDCSSEGDNDCDGQPDNSIDETCQCIEGAVEPCDEHPGNDGLGQCRAGSRSCVFDEETLTTSWGPCEGAVAPALQDTCDPGDDSDCDGTPNEGCSCVDGQTQACGSTTDVGPCQIGVSTCLSGGFGECVGAVAPALRDSCGVAGDDSNCNGVPNEGCTCVDGQTQPCGPDTNEGICQQGVRTCSGGVFGACVGAVFPQGRNCGSQNDNDCDGRPDNTIDNVCTCAAGELRACGTHPQDGIGRCQAGSQQCVLGPGGSSSSFGACSGSVGPATQDSCTVAGDDANCDGTPNGICQCVAGQGNAPCSGTPGASRCNAQGQCVPCQSNADCSLVSQGRNTCDIGVCVQASVCGNGVVEANEVCDDPFNPEPPIGACNRECTGFYQSKSILLTEGSYGTDLGGIVGADATCVSEFGAGWRALLVGGGRRATVTPFAGDGQVDWVLAPYTHYFNDAGFLIWRTDEVALLAARNGAYSPMLSPIFSQGDFFGPHAWSGYAGDWTTVPDGANAGGTCLGWTDVQGANIGASARHNAFMQGEFAERSITTLCGSTTLRLLCVEP